MWNNLKNGKPEIREVDHWKQWMPRAPEADATVPFGEIHRGTRQSIV
jgi:hypothetical protein